jgi:hypothetical protein
MKNVHHLCRCPAVLKIVRSLKQKRRNTDNISSIREHTLYEIFKSMYTIQPVFNRRMLCETGKDNKNIGNNIC